VNPASPGRHLKGQEEATVNQSRHDALETTHLTEQNFDETLLATPGLVMVDFWVEWCGPCWAIAPFLEELAEASQGRVTLMKVNVDESPTLAARYEIRSIPTILFVKKGAVVERVVGALPKAVLQRHIERASVGS